MHRLEISLDQDSKLSAHVDKAVGLTEIREQVRLLDGQLANAVRSIVSDIGVRHERLEKNIHANLLEQLSSAREAFERSVRRELESKVPEPGHREQLANELVEVFVRSTGGLAELKPITARAAATNGDGGWEMGIRGSLQQVVAGIQNLRAAVNLPLLLPASNEPDEAPPRAATSGHQK
jgi:hypothetical protein